MGILPTRYQYKRKRLIIVFVISLIITICLGGIFIFSFFRGFVDFPCFVTVENGILDLGGYEDYDKSSHAILFFTTFFEHTSGGGCKIVELYNGGSTYIGYYQVKVNANVITINGEHYLSTEEQYEEVNKRISLNPWYWYEDSFKISNHGYIIGIQLLDGNIQSLDHDLLVATGSLGSREHLNPITSILFFVALLDSIILGLIFLIQWIRGKKRDNSS